MAMVTPKDDFIPEEAASELKGAMKGLGTDEETITGILAAHTNEQRQEIKKSFTTQFGTDLIADLKSELGGDHEDCVVALMTPPRLFDAQQLYRAMKGGGTDEDSLIEILISRSNEEIEEIKELYKKEYDCDLVEDIQGDNQGYILRLLVSQCMAGRNADDGDYDDDLAEQEAQEIFEAGEEMLGTDEAAISRIFCLRSWSQLRATFRKFKDIADKDISESIGDETSGSLRDAYEAIILFARSPAHMFARDLYRSIAGAGTKDNPLIRQIVSRSEIDLRDIKEAYQLRYEKSLEEAIEGDCGGDYARLLLAICTLRRWGVYGIVLRTK